MSEYTFPKTLKRLRKERCLSQKKLAELSGLSQATIWKYEQDMAHPTINIIYAIADALEVPIETLLDIK